MPGLAAVHPYGPSEVTLEPKYFLKGLSKAFERLSKAFERLK